MLSKYHLSAGGSEAGHGEGCPAVHLRPGVRHLYVTNIKVSPSPGMLSFKKDLFYEKVSHGGGHLVFIPPFF